MIVVLARAPVVTASESNVHICSDGGSEDSTRLQFLRDLCAAFLESPRRFSYNS
jgi:hypothetical protein